MIEFINECDKLKLSVPKQYIIDRTYRLNIEPQGRFIGGSYTTRGDDVIIELSGKVFSTPTDLGSITKNNMERLADIIRENCGFEIEINYLLKHATLCRFDVKKDLIMEEPPKHYISNVREILNQSTNKYTIHRYDELKYEDGLTVIPKAKATKHKYVIYDKGTELNKTKAKHPEYYNQFEYYFLEDVKRMVRCEYQSTSFNDMRKVLNLSQYIQPSIEDIFEYKKDIVAEQFKRLLIA